jgi:hypothetical protein
LDRVRQALDEAQEAGKPAPGRRVLARLTGAKEHEVRKALKALEDGDEPVSTPDTEPAAAELVVSAAPVDAEPIPVATPVPPAGGKLVAWAGFLFGSATSIAANVLASRIVPPNAPPGWEPSLTAQLGAAAWPVALLLSVEVLSRVRWPSGVAWTLARFGGVGVVALGSALISYGHIRDVLLSWHYSELGAGVGPLVIDGLMTVCGFAMLATSGAVSSHDRPEA